MTAAIVGLPKAAQAVLAADVPYLEVYWWIWRRKRDGSYVLSNCRDGPEVGVRRRVGAFYLLKKRCLASVVEAKEEDRVF